jgi:ankyrin repeat protein
VHYVAGHLPDVDAAELVDIDIRRAKCVEVIAEFGADVNASTGDGRNYPLHKAAYARLEQTMLALVRAGADLKKTNGHGGETAEVVYKNSCERAGVPVNEALLAELAELASAAALPGYAVI